MNTIVGIIRLLLLLYFCSIVFSCSPQIDRKMGDDNLIYSDNKSVNYLEQLKNSKVSITLATWNIGHFSMGSKPYSTIDLASLEQKGRKYKDFINHTIRADILGINEYSNFFYEDNTNHILAKSFLFDRYRDQIEGPSISYTCNSLFSNIKLKKCRSVFFKSNHDFVKDPKIYNRKTYFIESEFFYSGKNVILVCVHILFSSNFPNEVQQNQIKELVDYYANKDRVIIIGDFNTRDLRQFKKNGYVTANDGSIVTYPNKKYPSDNIVAKGVNISNVYSIETDLSDHFPLVCEISITK